MRILCLHGRGTSASIFSSQTAAFRAKLGPSFSFDFVDGPVECTPAPGIDSIYNSLNYAWWPEETPEHVRAAHQWLDEYLATHGPYDAAMGFSQGCMLISSYLMSWSRQHGSAPPPFRAAIFICGGITMNWLESMGLPVSEEAHEIDRLSSAALRRRTSRFRELAANPELIQRGMTLWDETSDLQHEVGSPLPDADGDVFGLRYSDFPLDIFVQIPTVHVIGGKDPRLPGGVHLAYFCKNRQIYDHGSGHDIPRTTAVSVDIADLITKLNRQIKVQG